MNLLVEEENISLFQLHQLFKNVSKQNNDLKNKIQNKNNQRIQLAGTMNNKIVGIPLDKFQTPDINKSKNKTIMSEDRSNYTVTINTHHNDNSKFQEEMQSTHKSYESDEDTFVRDETVDFAQTHTMTACKRSNIDSPRNTNLLTHEESTVLKSCMKQLCEKWKFVQKENQRLKYEREQESIKYQK